MRKCLQNGLEENETAEIEAMAGAIGTTLDELESERNQPIGACILYVISCGLLIPILADRYEILQRTGGQSEPDEDEEPSADADAEVEEGSGSKVRLRPWNKHIRKSVGYDGDGRPAPLIDPVHRPMHVARGRRGPPGRIPRRAWPPAQHPIPSAPAGADRAGPRRH